MRHPTVYARKPDLHLTVYPSGLTMVAYDSERAGLVVVGAMPLWLALDRVNQSLRFVFVHQGRPRQALADEVQAVST